MTVKSAWDAIELPAETPAQIKKDIEAEKERGEEEIDLIKGCFNTPAGRRCLEVLHKRYVDKQRFDPAARNPSEQGFFNDGVAWLIMDLERKAQGED